MRLSRLRAGRFLSACGGYSTGDASSKFAALAAAAGAAGAVIAAGRDRRSELPKPWLRCEVPEHMAAVAPKPIDLPLGSKLVMSADCGGTTTRLMLYSVNPNDEIVPKQEAPGTLISEEKYPNIAFKSLQDIVRTFLTQDCHLPGDASVTVAVFALAGVPMNNQVRFTNLDWFVKGSEIEEEFKIGKVELINDFVAQGYGMLTLGDKEVRKLNDVDPQPGAPICCVGAGTGLGQCFLVADPSTGEYRCFPSEGQHGDFGPRGAGSDEQQLDMLKYLKIKYSGAGSRISIERVVSGTGICNIYEYLAFRHPDRVDKEIHKAHLARPKDAGIIAANMKPGSICEQAMKIFADCYGAQCGTFSLYVQPFGGCYLTGGVTQKNAQWLLDEGSFMDAFYDKGRLTGVLRQVPLLIVNSDDMGQKGAHLRAVKLLKEEVKNQARRLFDKLDINKDGVLKAGELKALFQVVGNQLGPDRDTLAEKLLGELDADHNGEISFDEFLRGFYKVPSKLIQDSPLRTSEAEAPAPSWKREELVAPPDRGNDAESQAQLAEVLRQFQSRSRRQYIDPFEAKNAPVFQTVLWKSYPKEDRMKEDTWLRRQYWINTIGAICYHSVTENKALLYCSKKDLAYGEITEIGYDETACKHWIFKLQPKPQNGTTLAPTEFAASTKEIYEAWLTQLRKLQKEAQEEIAKGLL
mmetsp:Transcript_89258/g.158292  ORF Transcript_89258/g.158292 Transcript_89258/m.158292 type:complete len:692 (-) Transcript_89258:42-2117(-)